MSSRRLQWSTYLISSGGRDVEPVLDREPHSYPMGHLALAQVGRPDCGEQGLANIRSRRLRWRAGRRRRTGARPASARIRRSVRSATTSPSARSWARRGGPLL